MECENESAHNVCRFFPQTIDLSSIGQHKDWNYTSSLSVLNPVHNCLCLKEILRPTLSTVWLLVADMAVMGFQSLSECFSVLIRRNVTNQLLNEIKWTLSTKIVIQKVSWCLQFTREGWSFIAAHVVFT